MSDYMVRGTAANGHIRGFAIRSTELVSKMQKTHNTSPNVTAALGRLMTGAVMMGSMLKDDQAKLTLSIRSNGPIEGMTVTADSHGVVKGFPNVARVPLEEMYPGKLNVGASVGAGALTVIRNDGVGEPYTSQIDLQTGEIGDDLTYYFAASEQVPSAVGLGVLVDTDESVMDAGGFIIQLMPDVLDEEITQLEEALKATSSITALLEEGLTPEYILERILGGLGYETLDTIEVRNECDCSEEHIERVLLSLPKSDLQEMIDDGKPIEIKCHFCKKKYTFTPDRLKELIG